MKYLILNRKVQEVIHIGETITMWVSGVTPLLTGGYDVKLEFQSDANIDIHYKGNNITTVNKDVTISIVETIDLMNGDYDISLGFNAPSYITIDRDEVRKRRIKNIDRAFNGSNI